MAKGFVYILTNPCLQGWVKIGKTKNVNERLARLNSPANIPYTFRVFATYECEDTGSVETCIHNLIDTINPELRARETRDSGKDRVREFFAMTPEDAYNVFFELAKHDGKLDMLKMANRTATENEEEKISESAVKRTRRPNTKFKNIDVPIGSQLQYKDDDKIICMTIDELNGVEYNGIRCKLGDVVNELLTSEGKCANVNPFKYFRYKGEILFDLRDDLDEETDD